MTGMKCRWNGIFHTDTADFYSALLLFTPGAACYWSIFNLKAKIRDWANGQTQQHMWTYPFYGQ